MILEDKLKACQRLKKNLSEQLSRTGENMWAIIDQYKEKLSLAATYEQRLEDEYAKCRNLPFGGRAMRGPWVRLPRGENARSRHQCLFGENVEKTKMRSTKFKCERFKSCFYARGRY